MPLTLIILAIIGFSIAGHISLTKHRKRPLVCPLGHHCDAVVHSQYNKLFGIPNEALGLFYYGAVFLLGVLLASGVSQIAGIPLLAILLLIAVPALLMSAVLTHIQVFILRHYCTWCLMSAAVNVLIVTVVLFLI